jgi:hypothetical protein
MHLICVCDITRIYCYNSQHSDKGKEICHHQPSSPAAASCCPVIQTLPSTFVVVAVAVLVLVLVAVVAAVGVAVAELKDLYFCHNSLDCTLVIL